MLTRVEKLPSAIRRALIELSYQGSTINLSVCESIGLSNPADDYARSFAGTVDLRSGISNIKWSGFDDAQRNDPFPENPIIELNQSLAVVKGSHENNTITAYLFLHPTLMESFRSKAIPITHLQKEVLFTYASIISKYRKGRLESAQRNYPDESFEQSVENLIQRGLLKRYPKGSIRITDKGRIALDSNQ